MAHSHENTAECGCNHAAPRLTVNSVLRADPTRTLTLRTRFSNEMRRRFRLLQRDIKISIVDNDCFGLRGNDGVIGLTPVPRRAFAFDTDASKIEAFMAWLDEQTQSYVLGQGGARVTTRPGTGGLNARWTDTYVESGYQRGIRRGRAELRRAGYEVPSFGAGDPIAGVMNQPFHVDRLAVIYTRTYSQLRGITAAMDTQISRVLAEGLLRGDNPRDLARTINSVIGLPSVPVPNPPGVGGTRTMSSIERARTLARTEVISAHHQATIAEYGRMGLENVRVKAEWATAGFGVCPICAELEGQIFPLNEIQSMIPAHPNCRCVALPVSPDTNPEAFR